eukprot:979417-Pelagomonas_calceolata.AAC.5
MDVLSLRHGRVRLQHADQWLTCICAPFSTSAQLLHPLGLIGDLKKKPGGLRAGTTTAEQE